MKYYNDNGKLHRENGPAVVRENGSRVWYFNGEQYRVNGPGDKQWYLNGKLHRENGPAVEYSDGYKAWYINGTNYNEKKYELEIERIRKIRFKYFKLWEEICDQPGKKLFNIRMNRAMDNIDELF